MSLAVSIIVTTYNQRRFLEPMIEMLNNQTFKDFEIIVVDNNSNDGTREWLISNKQEFSHLILNDQNLGLCKSFNQGVSVSTGMYLIDLSPDDLFTSNKLEQNVKLLKKENAHLLFSDCLLSQHGSTCLHSEQYRFNYEGKGNYYLDILERHCLISPTMVMSRDCFDYLDGYDESLSYEDFDFMTRASALFDIVYDPSALVIKQKVNKSLSAQFLLRNSPLHSTTFNVCKKNFRMKKGNKQALESRILKEAIPQLKLFNFSLVLKYLLLWFRNRYDN